MKENDNGHKSKIKYALLNQLDDSDDNSTQRNIDINIKNKNKRENSTVNLKISSLKKLNEELEKEEVEEEQTEPIIKEVIKTIEQTNLYDKYLEAREKLPFRHFLNKCELSRTEVDRLEELSATT